MWIFLVTYFRDGSIYRGEYVNGLEEGQGGISYPNGNVLTGDFAGGKIHGHTVLRYANGDQREGFFKENELDGQVNNANKQALKIMLSYNRYKLNSIVNRCPD